MEHKRIIAQRDNNSTPLKMYKHSVTKVSLVPVFKLSFVYVPVNKRSFVLMCKQKG